MVLTMTPPPVKIDARVVFDSKRRLYDLQFKALGTNCRIQYSATSNDHAAVFAREAVQWVASFEGKYSRFREDSLISEINRNAGVCWTKIDAEVESIFAICDDLNLLQPIIKVYCLPKANDQFG